MLVAGLEPARGCPRGILSPLRLPIPPHLRTLCLSHYCVKWAEVDSNHRSNLQQIYSLSPLATRESTHISGLQESHRKQIVAHVFIKIKQIQIQLQKFSAK